ncbi:4Fe-4S dicluster domain-containing protein [Carboxydothermus islandicus]|uniref:4Fe-4S dicluster domain-containing protein n=1 Tax=Carboxydothermus islandicus TaxID=661089 RepID=UPI00096A2B83|nr:4Fe-4S dicluster domain-containing protein [Carboxydothermus islandicus]
MARYGMVIDLRKCRGCRGCTAVCAVENNVPVDRTGEEAGEQLARWAAGELDYYNMRVLTATVYGQIRSIPMPCMHCDNAPCITVCPVKASYKRKDGIVAIDKDKCIGCRLCLKACPYQARYIRKVPVKGEPKGVAGKCEFCAHLVDKGEKTMCSRSCHSGAIKFGDLDDPNSEVSQLLKQNAKKVKRLKPEYKTSPRVYYITF